MTRQQFIRNTLNAIQAQNATTTTTTTTTMTRTTEDSDNVFSPTLPTSGEVDMRNEVEAAGGGGGESSPNQSRISLGGGGGGTESPSRPGTGTGTGLGLSQRSESVMTVNSVGSNKSIEANLQLVLKVRSSLFVSPSSLSLNRLRRRRTGYVQRYSFATNLSIFVFINCEPPFD
jgi:hypothetical protein